MGLREDCQPFFEVTRGCYVAVSTRGGVVSGDISSHGGCEGLSASFGQSCGSWRFVSLLSAVWVIEGACQKVVITCGTGGELERGQRQEAREHKHHPAAINPLMAHVMSRGIRFSARESLINAFVLLIFTICDE